MSGHVQRGLELLRDALAGVGSPLESDLGSALKAWGVQHGRLVARGLHYEPRAPEAVPSATAMRLDTLWAAGFGLNRVERIRCYPALAQHLFEALESGDTLRVVRGLCMYHLIADYPTHLLGGTLLGARHATQALAEQADDPFCDAWVLLADAFEHWFAGRPQSLQCFKDAAELLQERCVGAAPELGFTQQMILGHYMAVGAWDLITVECQRFGTDAAARNDRLYDFMFELEHVFRALLSGDPPAAQRGLERVFIAVRERREETTFPVHFARGHVATAMGDVVLLEQLLEWTRAFLQRPEARLPNFRVIVKLNEGRLAANIAAHSSGERRRTALEESDQALMAASAVGFEALGASVLLTRAGVALAQGKRELAKAMLEATIAGVPPYGGLIADLARYHHARLAGGASGDPALCTAERDLHARGVRDVGLLTAALAPLLAQSANAGAE